MTLASKTPNRTTRSVRVLRTERATAAAGALERRRHSVPGRVNEGFLLTVLAIAGVFCGLALWEVNTVFTLRDFEIETRRLQEIERERRDYANALHARLGKLQSKESLRAAAIANFGMTDPDPGLVRTLEVPESTRERWAAAERQAARFVQAAEEAQTRTDRPRNVWPDTTDEEPESGAADSTQGRTN